MCVCVCVCVCVTHQSEGVTEQSQSVLSIEISEDVEIEREIFRRVGRSVESLTFRVHLHTCRNVGSTHDHV